MQLRCLHVDSFSFEVQNHDPDSEGRPGASADLGGSIVVFVAVERADASRPTRTADAAADRIAEMADRLDERAIALVPCAQLTDSPASTSDAGDVIDTLADRLDFEIHTVPLGESISFELDARGHPFANQAFEIDPADRPDGECLVVEADGSSVEAVGERPVLDDGRLIDPLPTDQLAAPSESGPIRFAEDGTVLPEGVFLRNLVSELATGRLREHGAVPVDRSEATGPTALPGNEPPRSVFETAPSRGETTRPTPTLTTVVPTRSEALAEAEQQIDLVSDLLADLSVPSEPVCRVTESFFDEHRDWIATLAGRFDQQLLVERHAESDRPFGLEFVVLGDHSRLVSPAVWVDNSNHGATVVQSTPLDDPIRFVAALCRTAAAADRPHLPTWLAPIQLRLIPIEPADIGTCDALADRLESSGVRVDIDDRDLPVSERLDTADEEWIPYDAVVSEGDGETIRATSRAEQTEREFTPEELAGRISEESADWPGGARPVPRRYSDRPETLR